MASIQTFANGRMEERETGVVQEFPLVLRVNDRELATLVASPHDLRFLVAGFLRMQGFVSSVNDFLMLSVCNDFGIANVRIRGELPERLKPVLTSGCGAGISFNLDLPPAGAVSDSISISPAAIFRLMDELAKKADNYRTHGGIHSAALGHADGTLILYAEDLGRHNTVDRIAGEALLRGIDLRGKVMVTSGRVSTEMASKCARMGISVIASRTSPTDLAIRMCDETGITLVGYVRGGKFNVYTHSHRVAVPASVPAAGRKIAGVTAAILAGGQSSRMGSNKALLPYKGGRFIEAIYRLLDELFDEVILVTNNPEQYAFLPCRKVADVFPGVGALAGLHSGLHHAANERIFAVACDMPYLDPALIRKLAAQAPEADITAPASPAGLEPLHAFYAKSCLPLMEGALAHGARRIVSFFEAANVAVVPAGEIAQYDPEFNSFSNINTPDEYYRLRDGETTGATVAENPENLLEPQIKAG